MAQYIVTGRPYRGKTRLAHWLCDRLLQPVAGLRSPCTGRCAGGPLFSLQDLTTGTMVPISREETGQVRGIPEAFAGFGTEVLRAAAQSDAPTVLVDEVGRFERDCTGYLAALNALRAHTSAVQIDLDEEAPAAVRARLAPDLPAPLHAAAGVRLFREEKCFGPGPLELLELVARTGSLHQAASVMGMAYSKAWKMLKELEHQWGFAMVERHGGGAGGGGSLLTLRAWELLRRYRALQWESEQAVRRSFGRWFADF